MAHLHKKMKKGRPYYYIREIARVDGKPKVVNQIYLGSVERLLELSKGAGGEVCLKISVQEFGALWLANLIEQKVGVVSIVDSVVPKTGDQEKGPSVGEYFLYAAWNRMIDACSKRALPEWFRSTAIQFIRPVDVDALDSRRYWEKWDRVTEEHIKTIAAKLFERVAQIEKSNSDCFLFDTTNYYTYMASGTDSKLARRGKNKDGKDWLRQVGVALLVNRESKLPFFYREYEGNQHDSVLFRSLLAQVFEAMKRAASEKGDLTLVFDKGMNSEENIGLIDTHERLHFITSYSPAFATDLTAVRLSQFKPVDSLVNRELARLGRQDNQILAWRTTSELWGKQRTVLVTYNPATAANQRYAFDKKLLRLQETLFELRTKVRTQKPHWIKKEIIDKHYREACEHLHIPKDLYEFSLEKEEDKWKLVFRKNYYRIGKHIERFGKNILVTDHMDWSTDQIAQASLDRYMVEQSFRLTKDDGLVGVMPIRHWTDSKIRCHILACIISLCCLRLLEIRLHKSGLDISAATAMEQMHKLHSCLCWTAASKNAPQRIIEEPTDLQARIMEAFGFKTAGGVLQKIEN